MTKEKLAQDYELFTFGQKPGLGTMFTPDMPNEVYQYFSDLGKKTLSKVQLNQLLVISKAGSVSDGFFKYYWKNAEKHPYDVRRVDFFDETWLTGTDQNILSHEHFKWGLSRIYIDSLLYFGNVHAGFNALRSFSYQDLCDFYALKRFDTEAIASRGPSLPLKDISKDDRYLISEMACKTFGDVPEDANIARKELSEALAKHLKSGGKQITFKQLLTEHSAPLAKDQYLLTFDDVLENQVTDQADLFKSFDEQFDKFIKAREAAVQNTTLYLSLVNDLDVYVATSMRSRQNFREMANACEQIFNDPRLQHLHLRYFDPTMSAAKGHEDKGLIECLMVKCAKILVYCEGEKESYGKDAEAAMALSLGKPVIFYCDHGKRTSFYRDIHPLCRLIDFRSGVAVGAIVTDKVAEVAELLKRFIENTMEYRLEHHIKRRGYLKLVEKLTSSVVRLQTEDELIAATFWNNYHNRREEKFISLSAGKEAELLQK